MGELGGLERAVSAQPVTLEGRTMAVLYGSETGSAEDIAVELGAMAERLRFQTTVDEMDSFKLADVLRSSLVIFVTSTTGQGDMPKNTLKFWKNLRREKLNGTNCLKSLRFAIFGLGDSSYVKFNWAARKLRARLLQLGATEFFRDGEGDERHDNGIDSIYLPWCQELQKTLLADYPLPESVKPIPDDVPLPPKYLLELLPATDVDMDEDQNGVTEEERSLPASRTKNAARSHVDHPKTGTEQMAEDWKRLKVTFPADFARSDDLFERTNPRAFDTLDKDNILKDNPEKYLLEPLPPGAPQPPPAALLPIPDTRVAVVSRHDRVTPADHWQDVRHFTFDIDVGEPFLGDLARHVGHLTLVIWPKNYPEDVQDLIVEMGWEEVADKPIQLKGKPRALYAHDRVATLRQLLTHNLDITAVPKRNFIKQLMYFTEDEREIERLQELTAPGNEQEFYDYTCRPRRTILELLRDFTGVIIPFERVLDMFPIIRGREFSVANGGTSLKEAGRVNILRVEILVALVEYKTIIRKPRQGLCSRYLKHLPVGTPLNIRLKAASGPPTVPNSIWSKRPLIAIATGTGIAPIRATIQERASYHGSGDTLLFFGCRNRTADFHFEHEWDLYPNVKVYPAFSRDSIEPDPKTTVSAAPPAAGDVSAAIEVLNPVRYDAHKNYVQHLIRAHADEVGRLMRQHPLICVCGNAGRMPVSVRAALVDALVMSEVVADAAQAEAWLVHPDKVVYWQETW